MQSEKFKVIHPIQNKNGNTLPSIIGTTKAICTTTDIELAEEIVKTANNKPASFEAWITEAQQESLTHEIYLTLMAAPYYNEEGEKIEPDMGDMGNVRDAAEYIVTEWLKKENIKIVQ